MNDKTIQQYVDHFALSDQQLTIVLMCLLLIVVVCMLSLISDFGDPKT
jgi:hypothetical protein